MRKSKARFRSCSKSVELGNTKIDYVVEWRNVRYPCMQFRTGKLLVVLPRNLDNELGLLQRKKEWILKKYSRIEQILKAAYDNIKENRIPIFGENFMITPSEKFSFDENQKTIRMNFQNPRHRGKLVKRFKILLADEINSMLKNYENLTEDKKFRIAIRQQRTRWASFSTSGCLSFNLKMVFMPRDVIEYVVYHELTHIKQRWHDNKFWDKIEDRYANYKDYEKQLYNHWFLSQQYLKVLSVNS